MNQKNKITKDSEVIVVRRKSETCFSFATPSHGLMEFTTKSLLKDFMDRNKLLYIVKNSKS